MPYRFRRNAVMLAGSAVLILLAACGHGAQPNAPDNVPREFRLHVMPESLFNPGSAATFELLLRTDANGSVEAQVHARAATQLKALYFELDYDPERFTPLSAEAGDDFTAAFAGAELLTLSELSRPGHAAFGCVVPLPQQHAGFSGAGLLARVHFSPRPYAAPHTASALPDTPEARAVLSLATQNTLAWQFTNPGDYDQNGEVNGSDLTPLAQSFRSASPDVLNPDAALWLVDGDHNGEINAADIKVIGANFLHTLSSYQVFASSDTADYPIDNTAPNGANAQLLGEVELSAALGAPTDRKHFEFALPDSGRKYWVRPASPAGVGSPSNMLDTEVRLKADALVVSAAALADLASFGVDGTLSFSAGHAELAALEPGDVIVAEPSANAPNGLLRRVTGTAGGGTVLSTEPAELTDLFERGLLAAQIQLQQADVKSASTALDGVSWLRDKRSSTASGSEFFLGVDSVVLADEDGNASTKQDQIRLDGSLGIDPELLFNLEIDLDGIQELTFGASVSINTSLTLTGNYAKTWNEELVLYTWHFVPITIYVGPVPVVLVPSIELVLGASGTINAGVVLSVSDDAYAMAKVGYADGDWGGFSDYDNTFNFADPVLNGTASAKAYGGIRPRLELYGVAGAYGVVDAYLQANADIGANPWYTLLGGLEAKLGFDALGLTHEEPIFNFSELLDQAQGAFTPSTSAPSHAAWFGNSAGHIDSIASLLPMPDGGYIAGGETFGDLLLLRVAADGSVDWSKQFGAGCVNSMCWAGDGSIVAVGSEIGDAMLMKFSPSGSVFWINKLGANAGTADELFAVQPLKFGGYLAAGTLGSDATFSDAWIVAFDEQGSVLSSTAWPDPGDGFLRTLVRLQDQDGTLLAAGQSPGGPGGGDGLLVWIDGTGSVIASSELRLYPTGQAQEDYWEWVTTASARADGYYLAGQTNRGGITQWAARLDNSGIPQWAKLTGGGGFALTWDVNAACTAQDGGFVVAGVTGEDAGAGAWDGFVLKYDGAGDVSWASAFGGADNDRLLAIALPFDGKGILAAGRSDSFTPDDDGDLFTLRLTDTGTVFFATGSGASATSLSGSTQDCDLSLTSQGPATVTPTLDLESSDSPAQEWATTVHVISQGL